MARSRVDLPIARWLRGLLAGLALVAVVTGVVALLEPHVPVLGLLVLYLFAVLPVAVVWGALPAAATSIIGVGTFAFIFLSPTDRPAERPQAVALAVFLVTAVVVAELAVRSRRSAVESAHLTTEQSALRRVATLVAESVAPSILFEAVTREIGLLCGADFARLVRYEPDGTAFGVAGWSKGRVRLAVGTRFTLDGPSVASEVRRAGGPVRIDSFDRAQGTVADEVRAAGVRSAVGCPIVVAGQVWGVIAATTTSDAPFPATTESQIASFTELIATAVENAEARDKLHRIADEQAALRRIATLVARGERPDLVISAVAAEVGALFTADATALVRFEPAGQAVYMGGRGWLADYRPGQLFTPRPGLAIALVRDTGRAARTMTEAEAELRKKADGTAPEGVTEYERQEEIRSAVASPIVVDGRLWGAINIGSRQGPLPHDTEQRMADFTELVATAVANAEAHTRLTQSRARLLTTADETRRRIERDLHDGAQQRLVSLALELRLAQDTVPAYLPALRARVGQAAVDVTEVVDELREMSRGIHPSILSEGGLGPALRILARRSAVPVQVRVDTISRYRPPVEVAVYYVVSEALTNTAKHASASRVEVTVEERDTTLRLRVGDDGVGGAEPRQGSGLIGLRDRVEALGGSIDVTSHSGDGTVIQVSLPIDPAHQTPI